MGNTTHSMLSDRTQVHMDHQNSYLLMHASIEIHTYIRANKAMN